MPNHMLQSKKIVAWIDVHAKALRAATAAAL